MADANKLTPDQIEYLEKLIKEKREGYWLILWEKSWMETHEVMKGLIDEGAMQHARQKLAKARDENTDREKIANLEDEVNERKDRMRLHAKMVAMASEMPSMIEHFEKILSEGR